MINDTEYTFKVGDRIIDCEDDIGTIVEIDGSECKVDYDTWTDKCNNYSSKGYMDLEDCFHYYKKVKATKLARKLYPNAEEKDGFLEVPID